MTTKPDDIPNDVWREALVRVGTSDNVEMHATWIARAILKAKNDAYEECAAVADASEDDWMASGVEGIPRDIARAIRNLKHETEV